MESSSIETLPPSSLLKSLELFKRRVRTHTQERPYACPLCNKPFQDRTILPLIVVRMSSAQISRGFYLISQTLRVKSVTSCQLKRLLWLEEGSIDECSPPGQRQENSYIVSVTPCNRCTFLGSWTSMMSDPYTHLSRVFDQLKFKSTAHEHV